MRRHTVTRSAYLLLTTLVLAGCGDDDDDENGLGPEGRWPDGCVISSGCNAAETGEVTGLVSGDVDESVSGRAVFLEEDDGSWVLIMGTDYEGESGIFFAGDGGRPSTGTHAFDATTAELGAYYLHGPSEDFYRAEEGELTVTQSSSSRVAGGFEFTASDEHGNVVTVAGSFNAPKGQGGGITIEGTFNAPNVAEP